jgi:hypothetical protein
MSTTESTVTVAWTLTDAGDTAKTADTPLYIGVYTSASDPTAQNVVDGGGVDFLRRITITDGKTTSSETIGDFSPGSDSALSPATTYYVYVVAADSAGNQTARQDLVATTTDTSAPIALSSVTVSLGSNDSSSEIEFANLNAITDNVAVTSISVLYNTVNNSGAATSGAATVGVDTFTVTGLAENTTYYCWTTASDGAGNISTPTAVTGGSITTAAAVAEPVVNKNGDTLTLPYVIPGGFGFISQPITTAGLLEVEMTATVTMDQSRFQFGFKNINTSYVDSTTVGGCYVYQSNANIIPNPGASSVSLINTAADVFFTLRYTTSLGTTYLSWEQPQGTVLYQYTITPTVIPTEIDFQIRGLNSIITLHNYNLTVTY